MRAARSTAPVAYASELNNYGVFLLSMKRLEPAGDAFEEAQRIFDAKLGATHPNSIAVTVNRGTLAERRHKLARAAELYQMAVDRSPKCCCQLWRLPTRLIPHCSQN